MARLLERQFGLVARIRAGQTWKAGTSVTSPWKFPDCTSSQFGLARKLEIGPGNRLE